MGIIDDDHIRLSKHGLKFLGILFNPDVIEPLVFEGKFDTFVRDGLQDVMKFGFGHVKGCFAWVQDVPMGIDAQEPEERDQGMAHKGDASPLRRRIEKDQLLAFKVASKGEQERKIF